MNMLDALKLASESKGKYLVRPISWRCNGSAYYVHPSGLVHIKHGSTDRAHLTSVTRDIFGEWEPLLPPLAIHTSKKWETVYMDRHAEWEALRLPNYEDISEEIEWFDAEENRDGTSSGEWRWYDDQRWLIICGTYNESHAPGASGYTFALLFSSEMSYCDYKKSLHKMLCDNREDME